MGHIRIEFSAAIILAFALSFIATGCAPTTKAPGRTKVSVASAPPGARANLIWGGLAALVTRESKSVQMNLLTTRGAVEDIRLIETEKAEFGIGVATLVDLAIKGKKMFRKPYRNLCGLGPVTASLFHIAVRKDSGIKKIADLNGKRVNFARRGSTTHFMTRTVFGLAGIKVREEYLNLNVAADAVREKRLDAFTIPNPVPSPAVLRVAHFAPISLLPVEGRVLTEMLKANSAYFPIMILANSYNGQTDEVPTIGYTAWTIVGCDVPADVVYEVTRINYSKKGREFLRKVHNGWAIGFGIAPALDQMAAINMKINPGAARYWKEQGHKIPESIQ